MGELQPDDLDIDSRPLWQSDPKLWNKLSPTLKKQFTPKGQSPPTGPVSELSLAAQAERDYILHGDKYIPTRSEINNFTMEQHIRWSEAGGLERPDDPTPEEQAAQAAADEARAAGAQYLESLDDDQYRAVRQQQDAEYANQPHEVTSKS